jgi:predicted MFS family arabinose efflux permease
VICQLAFAATALILAAAVYWDFISYQLIVGLAVANGCTSVVEVPTRQSMISLIVPPDDLASALPLNASTFNAARVIGPSVGGLLLANFGPGFCYLANGLSYAALVFSVLAIRADLRSAALQSGSLKDALLEGIRYVVHTPAFRMLVAMMITSAIFGLFYLPMMSAFAKSVIHVQAQSFGWLLTATGVGAVAGVLTLATTSQRPIKGILPMFSMLGLGAGLLVLSFVNSFWAALPCLVFVGMFSVGQMVGTNTALQYFSPPELRGRVVSVHVWSLAGLSPIGALLFGFLSERIGLLAAYRLGGSIVLAVGLIVLLNSQPLRNLR